MEGVDFCSSDLSDGTSTSECAGSLGECLKRFSDCGIVRRVGKMCEQRWLGLFEQVLARFRPTSFVTALCLCHVQGKPGILCGQG